MAKSRRPFAYRNHNVFINKHQLSCTNHHLTADSDTANSSSRRSRHSFQLTAAFYLVTLAAGGSWERVSTRLRTATGQVLIAASSSSETVHIRSFTLSSLDKLPTERIMSQTQEEKKKDDTKVAEKDKRMGLPPSSSFSFTAPFPTTSSANNQATVKQRRVSLALPSSPKIFPAWSFRDDTAVDSHVASSSAPPPEKKGKMRKIAMDNDKPSDKPPPPTEKRQRKKWSEEETQMLVDGCNTVSPDAVHDAFVHNAFVHGGHALFHSGALVTGKPS